jgi:hypothetical protein
MEHSGECEIINVDRPARDFITAFLAPHGFSDELISHIRIQYRERGEAAMTTLDG